MILFPPGVQPGSDAALFFDLIPAMRAAGEAILAERRRGLAVTSKADLSPVTAADQAAEAILLAALHERAPAIPVVAEEEVAAGRVPALDGAFFLVDALDGTREFIAGGPDFTVNVGLIRDGSPTAGLILAPDLGILWLGVADWGARRIETGSEPDGRPIAVRQPERSRLDIVASHSHRTPETDAFIARFPGARLKAAGSSLKLIAIAEGTADLYPRLGPTSQWDIAAGDAIIRAAGGRVTDMTGNALVYGPNRTEGTHPFLNPWFVATGGLDPFA